MKLLIIADLAESFTILSDLADVLRPIFENLAGSKMTTSLL